MDSRGLSDMDPDQQEIVSSWRRYAVAVGVVVCVRCFCLLRVIGARAEKKTRREGHTEQTR